MFKIKYHYSPYLIVIVILLAIITVSYNNKQSSSLPAHYDNGVLYTYDHTPEVQYHWCDNPYCKEHLESCYAESDVEHMMRAYQIELNDKFISIWDGERLIGKLRYGTSLGKMMVKDNEQ